MTLIEQILQLVGEVKADARKLDEAIDRRKETYVCLASLEAVLLAAEELAEALKLLIEENVDYAKLNNLGDAEKQHNIRLGRKALTAYRAATGASQ